MKLEDQVTNLELSKRLKELGVKQESLFYWSLREDYTEGGEPKSYVKDEHYEVLYSEDKASYYAELLFSAFTVAELGLLLPKGFSSFQNREVKPEEEQRWGILAPTTRTWSISFRDKYDGVADIWADTEANARGKMLIFLLENKLITLQNKGEGRKESK